MTSIALPNKIKREVKTLSKDLGISADDLMINAVTFYTKRLKDRIALKKELEEWSQASIHDLAAFENSI